MLNGEIALLLTTCRFCAVNISRLLHDVLVIYRHQSDMRTWTVRAPNII